MKALPALTTPGLKNPYTEALEMLWQFDLQLMCVNLGTMPKEVLVPLLRGVKWAGARMMNPDYRVSYIERQKVRSMVVDRAAKLRELA